MTYQVKVSLSGPAFAFLLYENAKTPSNQEGFLIGEIVHKQTKSITDNDNIQINDIKIIKVKSVIPYPLSQYFYNNAGKINKEQIKEYLGPHFPNVVAWFKIKSTYNWKFWMREKLIHKQLCELFDRSPDVFTCCLLSTKTSGNLSTHSYEQCFTRLNNCVCDQLPIHISNLGDPNNKYQSDPGSSATFNRIFSELNINKEKSHGLVVVNKIHNALQKHINSVVEELAEAESQLFSLENDLKLLQEKKMICQELENHSLSSNDLYDSKFICNNDMPEKALELM